MEKNIYDEEMLKIIHTNYEKLRKSRVFRNQLQYESAKYQNTPKLSDVIALISFYVLFTALILVIVGVF